MKHPYEDILHISYPFETSRARMSQADRAAQFSPFAALVGYEESIRETGRLTEQKIELSEDAKKELNSALVQMQEHPEIPVSITYFVPDYLKKGGYYRKSTGTLLKIDSLRGYLQLSDGTGIWLDDILKIEEI